MTGGRQRSSAAIGALLVGLAIGPIASAQYTGAPFFEWTVLQSQAFGFGDGGAAAPDRRGPGAAA